jgi:hypothetical protein
MIKILNEKPSSTFDAKTLQYHFDGNEWIQMWEKKADAHYVERENYFQELEALRQQVLDGQLSPLDFHIYKKLFDIPLLSSYTGISKRHIKKHLKPEVFNQLDEKTLEKYATAFNITIEELKNVQI